MDFGEVLTRAWNIVWKFKVLWIFGILAGCGSGGAGFNNGVNYRFGGRPGEGPNLPPAFANGMERLFHSLQNLSVIAVLVSLACLLLLVVIFLTTVGRIGLIRGALQADGGAERLSFGELWSGSLRYFWRFILLYLLIGSPTLFLSLLLGGGFVLLVVLPELGRNSAGSVAPAALMLLPVLCALACVLFLLAVVLGFISQQAQNAIVVENEGVIGGIRRGWQVLTGNLGPILILYLILLVIVLGAGLVIALPVLVIVLPLVFAFVLNSGFNGGQISYAPLLIAGLCFAAYIPISLVARGTLVAYYESAWTLTYLRLTRSKSGPETPAAVPANA